MRAWATAGRLVGMGREATGGSTLAQRVLKRIGMACTVASTVGAVDVFLLLWLVLPPPHEAAAHFPEAEIANAVAFAIFLPLTLAIGWAWGYRLGRPWRRFLDEGREATESERIATLRYPLRSAKMGALLWGIGALLFVAVNLRFSGEVALHVGSTIVLGGLVTSALTYLLTEWLMRPVTARALADAAPPRLCGPGVQGRLMLAWAVCHGSAAARSRLPRDSCPYRGRVARASGGERPRAERRRGDGRPASNRACRTLGRRAARLPP